MAVHFTEPDMLKLVELYKEHECLWNMTLQSYKDRDARHMAYKNILEKLNIPNLTVKDIPNKIKNLRSSYYQEIKRIRRSVRVGTGDLYQPRVSWFTTVDEFLSPFTNERQLISKRPVSLARLAKKGTNVVQPQKEINKIDIIADNITQSNAKKKDDNEDEFDYFGRYIASTLRSMPQEFSIIAKNELQKTISEIQLKIVRQINSSSNQSPSCFTSSDFVNTISDSDISHIKIEYTD